MYLVACRFSAKWAMINQATFVFNFAGVSSAEGFVHFVCKVYLKKGVFLFNTKHLAFVFPS